MNKAFEKILDRLEERKQLHERMISYEHENGTITEEYQARKAVAVLNDAMKIVQEVAEEYKGGWIPCSERLPDADENVLTCSEYGFITVSSCNDAGEFSSYADEYCIKYPKPKVIAWQPIPEPYQPEGE